jgi:hypothetical protein
MTHEMQDLIHTNATIAFNAGVRYHHRRTLTALNELLADAYKAPLQNQGAKVIGTIEAIERAIASVEEGMA